MGILSCAISIRCAAMHYPKSDVFARREPFASFCCLVVAGRQRRLTQCSKNEYDHQYELESFPTTHAWIYCGGIGRTNADIHDIEVEDMGDHRWSCRKLAGRSQTFEKTYRTVLSVWSRGHYSATATDILYA
jgi:hypothetical protein